MCEVISIFRVDLQAINASSGRSLRTEFRIPTEDLTRRFDYDLKFGLMLKDARIAVDGLAACQEDRRNTSVLPAVRQMLEHSVHAQGYDVEEAPEPEIATRTYVRQVVLQIKCFKRK